jgi:hypothetical protein
MMTKERKVSKENPKRMMIGDRGEGHEMNKGRVTLKK